MTATIILTAVFAPLTLVAAAAVSEPRDANGRLIPTRRRTLRSDLRSMFGFAAY